MYDMEDMFTLAVRRRVLVEHWAGWVQVWRQRGMDIARFQRRRTLSAARAFVTQWRYFALTKVHTVFDHIMYL